MIGTLRRSRLHQKSGTAALKAKVSSQKQKAIGFCLLYDKIKT